MKVVWGKYRIWFDIITTDTPCALNQTTSLVESLRGSSQTPEVTQDSLGLTPLPHSFN